LSPTPPALPEGHPSHEAYFPGSPETGGFRLKNVVSPRIASMPTKNFIYYIVIYAPRDFSIPEQFQEFHVEYDPMDNQKSTSGHWTAV
jgi:hypothetical protein